jgi:hypothetical protein
VPRLDIRYVRSAGASIAYQVVGDGPVDLLYVPDYVSNLVYAWESAHWRRFYERLGESFRLILFDKRGTGLSDLGGQFPALETRMEDLRAVLDAVGSEAARDPRIARGLVRHDALCGDLSRADACNRALPAGRAGARPPRRRDARGACAPSQRVGHAGVLG